MQYSTSTTQVGEEENRRRGGSFPTARCKPRPSELKVPDGPTGPGQATASFSSFSPLSSSQKHWRTARSLGSSKNSHKESRNPEVGIGFEHPNHPSRHSRRQRAISAAPRASGMVFFFARSFSGRKGTKPHPAQGSSARLAHMVRGAQSVTVPFQDL